MSKKEKTAAEKLEAVLKYLNGEGGRRGIGEAYDASGSAVEKWVRKYKIFGIEGLQRPRKNAIYSPEMKLKAVKEALRGNLSQVEICKKYKIRSTTQLRNWIMVYNEHGNFNKQKQSGGGSYMKEGRNTTQEERIEIAKKRRKSTPNTHPKAIVVFGMTWIGTTKSPSTTNEFCESAVLWTLNLQLSTTTTAVPEMQKIHNIQPKTC